MSLKKGPLALSVFITIAPAQNNATSVQYGALAAQKRSAVSEGRHQHRIRSEPAATDSWSPPSRSTRRWISTARNSARCGWSLWSQKLNGNQPAGGTSGELTKSGAYAYYVQGDRRLAALALERAEAGRIKVKFEELPAGILESMQREFFNSDNTGAALVDVQQSAAPRRRQGRRRPLVIGPRGLFRCGLARRPRLRRSRKR